MKINISVQVLLIVLLTQACASATQMFSLDFSQFVPGTIPDAQAQGTGFTTRLAGTGSALSPTADTNLLIDRRVGVLRMTSTDADLNGQRNLPTTEALGINLSSLGYTGVEDFTVVAHYINVPTNFPAESDSFDQFGVFVGEDSAFMTRGGGTNYNFFGAPEFEAFGDNIVGGGKFDDMFFGPLTGNTMHIEISRTGGVWKTLVNGFDRTPLVQPNFLDAPDLTVGVWTYSTNGSQFTVYLDSFDVTVTPEPASLALLLAGVCGMASVRRK